MARRSKSVKKETVEDIKIEETVEPLVVEPVPKDEPRKVVRYFVASDKHVNCRRGIVKPNVEVFPNDFPGGTVTMDEHVKNGGLVKK